MKKIISLFFAMCIVVTSVIIPLSPIQAQEQEVEQNKLSCFDYYRFGSIQTNITKGTNTIVSGASTTFNVNIKNENPYPVVQGTLYVKIFKKEQAVVTEKSIFGPQVVDQFIAIDNISLDSNSSKDLSFSWYVPNTLSSGNYKIVSFFIVDKKFNLLGLSFTNDVIGNSLDFTINTENTKSTYFDHTKITINKNPYYFAAAPPRHESSGLVTIEAPITNQTDKFISIPISAKLYSWDGLREEALISSSTEYINLEPKETKTFSYSTSDNSSSVYYLVLEADNLGAKSILDIRFVRKDTNMPRLNFPSITSFPLVKGEENTVFSCYHNAGELSAENGFIDLKVVDKRGKEIASYTHSSDIDSQMSVIIKNFTPKKNYDYFSVVTTISHKGKVYDTSKITYDCKQINPDLCNSVSFGKIFTGILGLILILISAILIMKKRQKSLLIGILFFLPLLTFIPLNTVEAAKNITIQSYALTDLHALFEKSISLLKPANSSNVQNVSGISFKEEVIRNVNIQTNFSVNVFNKTTNTSLNENDTVAVEDSIEFRFKPYEYTDIFWNGTGIFMDTPYGYWSPGMNPPANTAGLSNPLQSGTYKIEGDDFRKKAVCNLSDFFETGDKRQVETLTTVPGGYSSGTTGRGDIDTHILFAVEPPSKTIDFKTQNLSCGTPNANGDITCTVTTAGPIIADFRYKTNWPYSTSAGTYYTKGKFYFRYYDKRDKFLMVLDTTYSSLSAIRKLVPGCYGNNYALTSGSDPLLNEAYEAIIPLPIIPYTLNAIQPNRPPNPPGITGPITGFPNTTYQFTFTATDPDNDPISYGIDWDNNNSVDQWLPQIYTTSGTTLSSSKIWDTTGAKTFKALTKDDKGSLSTWSSHTITIANPPTMTGSCQANISSAYTGQSITWTATVSGGTNHTYTWSGTDSLTGSTNIVNKTYATTGVKTAKVTIKSAGYTDLTVDCNPTTTTTINTLTITATPTGSCTAIPTINLTWNGISGMSYKIFRETTGQISTLTQIATVTGSSYSDTTALSGVFYTYYIGAVHNITNLSALSAPSASVTPNICPAEVPTNVRATSACGTSPSANVTWSSVTGANGYKVFKKVGTGNITQVGGTLLASTLSYTDTSVTEGQNITYYVKSVLNGLDSGYSVATENSSTTIQGTCPPTIIPTPTGLTSHARACEATPKTRLTWNAVSGMTYNIYRSTASNGTFGRITTNFTSADYTDVTGGLTAGGTYWYKISAVNSAGTESAQTSAVSAIASSPCGQAPVITLTASPNPVPYNSSTVLTWSATNNPTSCIATGGWSGSKSLTGGNETTVVLISTQTYTLTCSNSSGSDSKTVTVTVTTTPPPTPTLSVSLVANPSTGTAPLTSTLTATRGGTLAGTASYEFKCKSTDSWSTPQSSTTFTCSSLPAGTHTASVRITVAGQTALANATIIATGPTPTVPPAPTGLVTLARACESTAKISLQWNSVSAVSGYNIYRSSNGSVFSKINTSLVVTNEFTDVTGALTAGNTYWYRVTAVNSTGESPASNTVSGSASIPCTLSVSLAANPSTGTAPLTSTLTATRGGTLTGGTNSYRFRCTASGAWSAPQSSNTYQCSYPASGTFTAQVELTVGTQIATNSRNITVAEGIPQAPVLTGVTAPFCGNKINLSWTAVVGAVRYEVYSAGNLIYVGTGLATTATMPDPNTNYSFAMFSYTSTNAQSVESNTVTVKSSALCPVNIPVVTLTASPSTVPYNTPSTLTWSVTNNPTSCTASGAWSGSKSTTGGSQSTGNLTTNKTYTLTCENSSGPSEPASVTVTVTGDGSNPTGGTGGTGGTGCTDPNGCSTGGTGTVPGVSPDPNNPGVLGVTCRANNVVGTFGIPFTWRVVNVNGLTSTSDLAQFTYSWADDAGDVIPNIGIGITSRKTYLQTTSPIEQVAANVTVNYSSNGTVATGTCRATAAITNPNISEQ